MTVRSIIIILILSLLGMSIGCAATPQTSRLVGTCKQLKEEKDLWAWGGKGGTYAGPYFIAPIGRERIQALGRNQFRVGVLAPGTRVRVAQVIKGSTGSRVFLRVQVEILDEPYQGIIADIPTYTSYHPMPPWIAKKTLDPNELELSGEVFADCVGSGVMGGSGLRIGFLTQASGQPRSGLRIDFLTRASGQPRSGLRIDFLTRAPSQPRILSPAILPACRSSTSRSFSTVPTARATSRS
jgi:hypothetical protein